MKKFTTLLTFALLLSFQWAGAQTIEELTAQKDTKAAELAAAEAALAAAQATVDGLSGEVAALTEAITPYPRWDVGTNGTVGLGISGFSDWLSKDASNSTAVNIGLAAGAFANADFEKSFWRNGLNLTLGWLKFDNRDVEDENDGFQVAADAFNLTSLYGFKLSDKWAISTLGEYRTAMLDGKLNNPGYLDLGVGATWTPITDLVVVIHPLNYNWVFADDGGEFKSSLGAKIVGDYKRALTKNIAWKSNLSAFFSYEGSDLHNWTWINGLTTAYKGIGIGFDFGIRSSKQEANDAAANRPELGIEAGDNPLQTYYVLGFSYSI